MLSVSASSNSLTVPISFLAFAKFVFFFVKNKPSDVPNISMSQLPNELLNILSKGVFSDIESSLLKGHLLIIVLF
ncbi:hypothetical protein BpHYR1_041958 [Brachionus plicatilis]|uniref:Uncharacterized protein n=1 Tax=Brachionus plicatilis TaxID=10195 RepID=A0A3M7R2I7_BRAPC|nr:hypothetical protein BpHYR1_041958 [Brachionus plicatilis]